MLASSWPPFRFRSAFLACLIGAAFAAVAVPPILA